MKLLNLGILAHVDAGKTTLTERLLFAAGVIETFGSVDKGTTQTDTLELERRRGITIKSAVVSFDVAGTTVNLIDTPGHPDFIAEVERALAVLDGAVLVISAVEGVQPQTRILLRALRRLEVPTLLFVNKLDRLGADAERTVADIERRLGVAVARMDVAVDAGTRAARVLPWPDGAFRTHVLETLAAVSEEVLDGLLEGDEPEPLVALARETAAGRVHPCFFGSALTGVGATELLHGIATLLPAASADAAAPASARVFKIERSSTGERLAYARVFAGTLHVRERPAGAHGELRAISGIEVFEEGGSRRRAELAAGRIGRLAGLGDVRVGDDLGIPHPRRPVHFAPPTMESVVAPVRNDDGPALRVALRQLAEQDPLIDVRLDDAGGLSVSLYGEVQQEVLAATLEEDYGIAVRFEATTPVCVERPSGRGEAGASLRDPANPISATVGLRVEPLEPGEGVRFELGVESRLVPIYIYKTQAGFREAMTGYVLGALESGPHGWRVTDCRVTLTECDYYVGDGLVPAGRTRTAAADFRHLTPVVLRRALADAGTVVCEPFVLAGIEVPAASCNAVLSLAIGLRGVIVSSEHDGEVSRIEATLPAASLDALQHQLPAATGGEGFCESSFFGYREVHGAAPVRRRRASS